MRGKRFSFHIVGGDAKYDGQLISGDFQITGDQSGVRQPRMGISLRCCAWVCAACCWTALACCASAALAFIGPTDQVAYQALQTAQQKVDKAKAAEAQQANAVQQQASQTQATTAQRNTAMGLADAALVAGNLKVAADQLAIVLRISPNDVEAKALSAHVNQSLRNRMILMCTAGGGVLAVLVLLAGMFWKIAARKRPIWKSFPAWIAAGNSTSLATSCTSAPSRRIQAAARMRW